MYAVAAAATVATINNIGIGVASNVAFSAVWAPQPASQPANKQLVPTK